MTAEVIFSSPDVEIRHHRGNTKTCFVTFTALQQKSEEGFGERLMTSRNVSSFFFISKWNHWYQPESIREGAELVRSRLQEGDYDRVTTYGASMGGFSATAFAGLLGADRVIALAPQYSIDPDQPPFERRWMREFAKIKHDFSDLPHQVGGAAVTVVYDPLSSDRSHAELFGRLPNCELIPVPFCGHTPGRVLLHCGLLQKMPLDISDGCFDRHAFYSKLHTGRRAHYEYWTSIAACAQKTSKGLSGLRRSRLRIAVHAMGEARRLRPNESTFALQLAYLLLQLDRVHDAMAAAQQSVELAPDHPAPWRALSTALRRNKNFPEALEAARKAVLLRSGDLDLSRLLTQALISMQLFEEAVQEGRRALEIDPSYAEGHALVGACLRELGRRDEAIASLSRAVDLNPNVPAWTKHLAELHATDALDRESRSR